MNDNVVCTIVSVHPLGVSKETANTLTSITVRVGLSLLELLTTEPITLREGDELPFEDVAHGARVHSFTPQLMVSELQAYGQIDITTNPPTYEIGSDCEPLRRIYLLQMFEKMLDVGELVDISSVGPPGSLFFQYKDNPSAVCVVDFGWWMCDYSWKFRFEDAALHGIEQKRSFDTGRQLAAVESRRQGVRSKQAVKQAAHQVLVREPHLYYNQSALARAIMSLDKPPLKNDGTKLGHSSIRAHLQKLMKAKELT
jgi:hypothetical protein